MFAKDLILPPTSTSKHVVAAVVVINVIVAAVAVCFQFRPKAALVTEEKLGVNLLTPPSKGHAVT